MVKGKRCTVYARKDLSAADRLTRWPAPGFKFVPYETKERYMPKTPTKRTYDDFDAAYAYFNKRLFERAAAAVPDHGAAAPGRLRLLQPRALRFA